MNIIIAFACNTGISNNRFFSRTINVSHNIRFYINSALGKRINTTTVAAFVNNLADITRIQFSNRHSRSNHRLPCFRFAVRRCHIGITASGKQSKPKHCKRNTQF